MKRIKAIGIATLIATVFIMSGCTTGRVVYTTPKPPPDKVVVVHKHHLFYHRDKVYKVAN